MRVPDSLRVQMMKISLSTAAERLQRYQLELASGVRIQRPSDDPAGAQRISNLNSNLSKITQYLATANDAIAWLKSEDSALGNMTDSLRQIRDDALQAANPDMGGTRETMVGHIKASVGFLLQSLNASDGARFLFGGNKTQTVPFNGDLTVGITYAGDDGERRVALTESITLSLNHTGSEVTNLGGISDPTQPDLFQTLNDLITAIQSGDQTAIAVQIDTLDRHLERVLNIRGEAGIKLNQAQLAMDQLSQSRLILTSLLNETESSDLTEVMIHLKEQENVMQAATYVASTLGQGGLLNWLK